jgi:tetratricopeptide (TPR) repeat protein
MSLRNKILLPVVVLLLLGGGGILWQRHAQAQLQARSEYAEQLLHRANAAVDQMQNAQAEQLLNELLGIHGDYPRKEEFHGQALFSLAMVKEATGDNAAVIRNYQDALPLLRRYANAQSVAQCVASLGGAQLRKGDFAAAAKSFEESADILARTMMPDRTRAELSGILGDGLVRVGRLDKARPLLEAARAYYAQNEPAAAQMIDVELALGLLKYQSDELPAAQEHLHNARQILERAPAGNSVRLARVYQLSGLIASKQNDLESAKSLMLQGLELRARYQPDSDELAAAYFDLAQVADRAGYLPDAVKLLENTQKIYQRVYGPESVRVGTTLTTLADMYHRDGRDEDARAQLQRALPLYEKQPEQFETLMKIHALYGEIDLRAGHQCAALTHIRTAQQLAKDHALDWQSLIPPAMLKTMNTAPLAANCPAS